MQPPCHAVMLHTYQRTTLSRAWRLPGATTEQYLGDGLHARIFKYICSCAENSDLAYAILSNLPALSPRYHSRIIREIKTIHEIIPQKSATHLLLGPLSLALQSTYAYPHTLLYYVHTPRTRITARVHTSTTATNQCAPPNLLWKKKRGKGNL